MKKLLVMFLNTKVIYGLYWIFVSFFLRNKKDARYKEGVIP